MTRGADSSGHQGAVPLGRKILPTHFLASLDSTCQSSTVNVRRMRSDAEIISRSGDVSVLDWVGEALPFNNCFPTNLLAYRTVPDIQPIPCAPVRPNDVDFGKTQNLWSKPAGLPIIHQITAVQLQGFSTSPTRYTYEIHASRLTPLEVTPSGNLDEGAGRYVLARPWHPKALSMQTGSGDYRELLEQLMQPFNALLLKKLPHEEYRRIRERLYALPLVLGIRTAS